MADRTDDRAISPKTGDDASNAERVVTSDPKRPATRADKPSTGDKREIGGPKGPEPTRYGDWEKGGRCIDF